MSIANKADQIQDNNFISEYAKYAKLPEVKLLFFYFIISIR